MALDAGVQLYNFMETFYCCTVTSRKEFESVVSEHMLVYVISGELDVLYHDRRRHLQRGQAYLIRKNYRAHKIEYPSKDGKPFKGLFLQLKQVTIWRRAGFCSFLYFAIYKQRLNSG